MRNVKDSKDTRDITYVGKQRSTPKILLVSVCAMCVIFAFCLPWIYTAAGSVNGWAVFRGAYYLFDYFTVVNIMIAVLCLGISLYFLMKEKKHSLIVFLSFIGANASICAVDRTALNFMQETEQLVYRGVGNYLLLVVFCVITMAVLWNPLKQWLGTTKLVKIMSLNK